MDPDFPIKRRHILHIQTSALHIQDGCYVCKLKSLRQKELK
jgi:hypothetical protein